MALRLSNWYAAPPYLDRDHRPNARCPGAGRSGNLGAMSVERRNEGLDRRARTRGGRRNGDAKKPWYMRRRLWLATASLIYVGWRRVRSSFLARERVRRPAA
jgi:hypothetical protein